MARIDDYRAARALAIETLAEKSCEAISFRSGFQRVGKGQLQIPFLNRTYRLVCSDFSLCDEMESNKEVPLQEQVLILHYLEGSGADKPVGKWIAYREVPGASFYFSAFVKRAIDPLRKVFGYNLEGFTHAAQQLGGIQAHAGDAAYEFSVFPYVPVQLILHTGDEEFPPEANILFDQHVGTILSPEDIAWLAGMVVYRLIALVPK